MGKNRKRSLTLRTYIVHIGTYIKHKQSPAMPFPENSNDFPFVIPYTPLVAPDPDASLFRLTSSVGERGDNDRQDVIKTQILLGNLGYLDLTGLGGPTGWPGSELTRGLRRFQKDRGLTVDGMMLPDGETMQVLGGELADAMRGYQAPTPDEVDRHHEERTRQGEDDPRPVTTVVSMPDQDGRNEHPTGVRRPEAAPRITMSDVPDAEAELPQAGAQYAQVALPMPTPAPIPPTGTPPRPSHQDYGVTPEARALSRDVTRGFDKIRRAQDTIDTIGPANLLMLPSYMMREMTRQADPLPATPPSRPLSEEEKAMAKTPPLMPSAPDIDPVQGRPAAPEMQDIEKLIPPEFEARLGGLEPFDQELAKSLWLLLFEYKDAGSRGGPRTQEGNDILIRSFLRILEKEFPHLYGRIRHVAGGYLNGDPEVGPRLKEEYLRNPDTNRLGSSRTDVVFEFIQDIFFKYPADRERLRYNTFTTDALGNPIPWEISSRDQAEANANGRAVHMFPKLEKADTPEEEAHLNKEYEKAADIFNRERIAEWEIELQNKGLIRPR